MTDDLVRRLRLIGEREQQCTSCYKLIDTADEAADRIEELEAALRHVVKSWEEPCYGDDFARLDNVSAGIAAARAALEGKDD